MHEEHHKSLQSDHLLKALNQLYVLLRKALGQGCIPRVRGNVCSKVYNISVPQVFVAVSLQGKRF